MAGSPGECRRPEQCPLAVACPDHFAFRKPDRALAGMPMPGARSEPRSGESRTGDLGRLAAMNFDRLTRFTGLMPSAGLCRVLRGRFGAGAGGRGCDSRPNLIFSA